MKDIPLPVHPVADLFPMLPPDELDDLADDIKANGLQHPIVMKDGVLIDGRNRLAACKLADVEPTFEELNGVDPVVYIMSSNIARRHMTKAQRAMMAAQVLILNISQLEAGPIVQTSNQYISRASVVLKYAPDLAEGVLAGIIPLNDAYETAQDRKKAAESSETRMADLRIDAPDLADQVAEERLTLPEALAALRAREAAEESHLRSARSNLNNVLLFLTSQSIEPERLVDQDYAKVIGEFDPEQLQYAARTMQLIAERRRENDGPQG